MSFLRRLFGGSGSAFRDPVCGMKVEPATSQWTSTYGGSSFYFCSKGCKDAFDADPAKYGVGAASPGAAHEHH